MSFWEAMTQPRSLGGPGIEAAAAWGTAGLSTVGVFVPGVGNVMSAVGLAKEYKEAVAKSAHALEYGREGIEAADARVAGALVREDMNGLDPADRGSYVDALGRFADGDRTMAPTPSEGEAAAARLDHDLGAHRETHQAYLESACDQARAYQAEAAGSANAGSATPTEPDAEPEHSPEHEPMPDPSSATEPQPEGGAAPEAQISDTSPEPEPTDPAASEQTAHHPHVEAQNATPEPEVPVDGAATDATPVERMPEPDVGADPGPTPDTSPEPEPAPDPARATEPQPESAPEPEAQAHDATPEPEAVDPSAPEPGAPAPESPPQASVEPPMPEAPSEPGPASEEDTPGAERGPEPAPDPEPVPEPQPPARPEPDPVPEPEPEPEPS